MSSKKEILAATIGAGVEDLKRSVTSNSRKSRNSRVSDKVHSYLTDKYGTYSNGINTLALKDMGEL